GNCSDLWYRPDGTPGVSTKETLATDGWGSAAMLNALAEGLAGVVDSSKQYEDVTLSPRWAATDRKDITVALRYEATGAYFAYDLHFNPDNTISLAWGGKLTNVVHLHLMLPPGFTPDKVLLTGAPFTFTI